ncbi:DUF4267 domain-containing protein [Methylobacterium sp. JK268]
MHALAVGVALLAALGIIAIGILYLAAPWTATRSFGLPLPEEGAHVTWWLRLKGVRDVVSGLAVLAVLAWLGSRAAGLILLVEAVIPVGDMLLILAARGSGRRAIGMHGLTAVLMILAGMELLAGAS